MSENTVYRGTLLLGISMGTEKIENFINEDNVDKFKASGLTIGISGGIEKHRRMLGRLSGYYGAQAGIGKEPYSFYGDETSEIYYGKLVYKNGTDSNANYTEHGGNTISFMVGGIAGVEFFVAPKISLTGEFGYGLSFCRQGKRISEPATGDSETIDYGWAEIELAPSSSGNVVLLFYF